MEGSCMLGSKNMTKLGAEMHSSYLCFWSHKVEKIENV